MERQFHVVRREDLEGSDRSTQLALALAQKCDPQFLERILELKCSLDLIGGQVYVAAYRTKYDPVTGEAMTDVQAPGSYVTDGYVFQYGHIAKLNRQAREPDVKPEDTPDSLFPEDSPEEAEPVEGE